MLALFDTLIDLFRRESPRERYERACYEAEQEEKKRERMESERNLQKNVTFSEKGRIQNSRGGHVN